MVVDGYDLIYGLSMNILHFGGIWWSEMVYLVNSVWKQFIIIADLITMHTGFVTVHTI